MHRTFLSRTSSILVTFTGLALVFSGCEHEVDGVATDRMLFNQAQGDAYTYYTGTPTITAPNGASPHGDFRVRFNPVAEFALDSTGKLPAGASFPDGSIIVKDVYSGGSLSLFAIMKKDATNALAGSGWLWAEIEPDGEVVFSAGKKGDGCIGCHMDGNDRDLVRVFDLH